MAVKVYFFAIFLCIFVFSLTQSLPQYSSVKKKDHKTDPEPLITICFYCTCYEEDLLDCSGRNLDHLSDTFFDVIFYRYTRLNFRNTKGLFLIF